MLETALDWLAEKEDLRLDLEKYETVCCTPELLVQIARTPIDFINAGAVATELSEVPKPRPGRPRQRQPEIERVEEPLFAELAPAHNELEEFLL